MRVGSAAVGCGALPQGMCRVRGAGQGCACAAVGVPAGCACRAWAGSGASALERWAPPPCLPAVHSRLPPINCLGCLHACLQSTAFAASLLPPARARPHLQVWAPGAHAGAHHAGQGQGHPHQRARHPGHVRPAGPDRGQGCVGRSAWWALGWLGVAGRGVQHAAGGVCEPAGGPCMHWARSGLRKVPPFLRRQLADALLFAFAAPLPSGAQG